MDIKQKLEILKDIVYRIFDAHIISCSHIGGGASGEVQKITIDKPPFYLAIKSGKNAKLLKQEYEYISCINAVADIKLPKLYDYYADENQCFMLMEFFDGKNCADKFMINAPLKVRLAVAEQIADNIIKLQAVKGDKYGDLINPIYDNWHDYYRPFVANLSIQADILYKDGYINKKILKAIKSGERLYDKIFSEEISPPTPIHGDYWAQNIIIDKNYNLIGVVDPFNCMWGDSEYELFALNAIYGKKLPVLEAFIAKAGVSEKFWLKNSFYILVSETFWVCKLHHNNVAYLMRLTREFNRQLKKYDII